MTQKVYQARLRLQDDRLSSSVPPARRYHNHEHHDDQQEEQIRGSLQDQLDLEELLEVHVEPKLELEFELYFGNF